MALREIGARITLQGEAEWKKQLQSADREMKNLKSELAASSAEFNGQANSVAALTAKQKTLNAMKAQMEEKERALAQAVKDATKKWGEESAKTDDIIQKHNYAKASLENLNRSVDENAKYLEEAEKSGTGYATSIDGYGKKVKEAEGKTGLLNKALGNLNLAGIAGKLSIAGLGAAFKKTWDYASQLVDETKDLREGLAKLDAAAESAGAAVGTNLRESLESIYAINGGEMDSAMETLSNLLGAGFDGDNGLASAIEALSGAVIEFPDTLKIESLADSLQETLATGSATGQFEEMLGRVGIDTDAFSAALTRCTTQAERQNLVLQTLADTGLANVSEAYRAANSDMIRARELDYELEISKANVGRAWQGTVNAVTSARVAFNNFFADFSLHGIGMYTFIDAMARDAGTSFGEMQAYLRETGQSWIEYRNAQMESGLGNEEYWASLQAEKKAADDAAVSQQALAAAVSEQAPAVEEAMTALSELQAQYDGIRSSVDNAVSGFADMSNATENYQTSADAMIAALQSQQEYLANYKANLEEAKEMGLSDALIEELSDGSAQSAAYLQAIVDGGSASIDELNTAFEGVQTGKEAFVETVASMLPEFQAKLDEITGTLDGAVEDWNKYDDAANAGKNTIDGLLSSLRGRTSELISAGMAAGEAFMSGYNDAMEIRSPSRRMARAMDYTLDGGLNEIRSRARDMTAGGAMAASAFMRGYDTTVHVPVSAYATAAAGGSGQKNVTVNVTAQSMSQSDIYRLVNIVNAELGGR